MNTGTGPGPCVCILTFVCVCAYFVFVDEYLFVCVRVRESGYRPSGQTRSTWMLFVCDRGKQRGQTSVCVGREKEDTILVGRHEAPGCCVCAFVCVRQRKRIAWLADVSVTVCV